jgi:hypothetical protein
MEQDETQTKTDTIGSNSPAGGRAARRRPTSGRGRAGGGKQSSGRARGSIQGAGVDNESFSVGSNSRSSRKSKTSVGPKSPRKSTSSNSVELSSPLARVAGISQLGLAASHDFGFDDDDVSNRDKSSQGSSVSPRQASDSEEFTRSSSHGSEQDNTLEYSSPLARVAGISQVGLAASHDFGFDDDYVSNRDKSSEGSSVSPRQASDGEEFKINSSHGSEQDEASQLGKKSTHTDGSQSIPKASASSNFDGFGSIPKASSSSRSFGDSLSAASPGRGSIPVSSHNARSPSEYSRDITCSSSHLGEDESLSEGSRSSKRASADGSTSKYPLGSQQLSGDDEDFFPDSPKQLDNAQDFEFSNSKQQFDDSGDGDDFFSGTAKPPSVDLSASIGFSKTSDQDSMDDDFDNVFFSKSSQQPNVNESVSQRSTSSHQSRVNETKQSEGNGLDEFDDSSSHSSYEQPIDDASGSKGFKSSDHSSVDEPDHDEQDHDAMNEFDDSSSKASEQPSVFGSISKRSKGRSSVDESKSSQHEGINEFGDASFSRSSLYLQTNGMGQSRMNESKSSKHGSIKEFEDLFSSKSSKVPLADDSVSNKSKSSGRPSFDEPKSSEHEDINALDGGSSSKSSLHFQTNGTSRASINYSAISEFDDFFSSKPSAQSGADGSASRKSKSSSQQSADDSKATSEFDDFFSSKSSVHSSADGSVSRKSHSSRTSASSLNLQLHHNFRSSQRSSETDDSNYLLTGSVNEQPKPRTSKSSSSFMGRKPSQRHSKLSRDFGMKDDSSSSRGSISKRSVSSSASSVNVYNSESSQSERSRVKSSVSSRRKDTKKKGSSMAKSSRSSKPSILGMESFLPTILETAGVNLSKEKECVYSSVHNKGYLHAVDVAYEKLLGVRPRLNIFLSQAEWRHIHILMLYARIFDCEMAAANVTQPIEFRIAIPEEIKVFEPLARILSGIGIVDDPALGVRYIPVARTLREEYRPHDPDDVTEFLEWTQYDWKDSWTRVEEGRADRRMAAIEKGMIIPEAPRISDAAKLLEWEHLALQKWLGWDDKLWLDYEQAAHVLTRRATFVSFPTEFIGTYTWLIPREEEDSGFVCRIPKASLPADIWLISLLLDLSALPPSRTCTWYFRTTPTKKTSEMLDEYIGTSIE